MNNSYDDLPIGIQRLIRSLRKESSGFRIQRNEARAEVARLRAELAALREKLSTDA